MGLFTSILTDSTFSCRLIELQTAETLKDKPVELMTKKSKELKPLHRTQWIKYSEHAAIQAHIIASPSKLGYLKPQKKTTPRQGSYERIRITSSHVRHVTSLLYFPTADESPFRHATAELFDRLNTCRPADRILPAELH